MLVQSLSSILFLSTLAFAQETIPTELTKEFSDGLEVQASFTNNPSEGFADGASFSPQIAQNTPRFALGDASGVNTQLTFAMLMVDVSCAPQLTLHYAQTGFKANLDKTQIDSKDAPSLSYQGPGTFQETGSRTYNFLMYIQETENSVLTGLPAPGTPFDIKKFVEENQIGSARAGVGFKSTLGGSEAGKCEAGTAPPPPPPPPEQNSTAVPLPPPSTLTPAPVPGSNSTIPPPPPAGNGTFTPPPAVPSSNSTATPGGGETPTVNPAGTETGAPGGATSAPPEPTGAASALGVDASLALALGLGAIGLIV